MKTFLLTFWAGLWRSLALLALLLVGAVIYNLSSIYFYNTTMSIGRGIVILSALGILLTVIYVIGYAFRENDE